MITSREEFTSIIEASWTPPRRAAAVYGGGSKSGSKSKSVTVGSAAAAGAAATAAAAPPYALPPLGKHSVLATFDHLFNHFRYGTFVSLRGGRLHAFVSFANLRFRNPVAHLLKLENASVKHAEQQGFRINKIASSWTTTDCLLSGVVKTTAPEERNGIDPGHSLAEVQVWLERMGGTLPDCDFFLNTTDMCLIRNDLCETQLNITGGRLIPVKGLLPGSLCAVASFGGSPDHADIAFPTPQDLGRVMRVYGAPRCANPGSGTEYKQAPAWSRRHNAAVFRGQATGCGWTSGDNPRLAAAALTVRLLKEHPDRLPPTVDARLTGQHDVRFKKDKTERFARFHTDPVLAHQSPDHTLDLSQQAQYKYIIDLPGNAAAYRLGTTFSLGALVIVVPHPQSRVWFFPYLRHKHNCIILPSDVHGRKLQELLLETVRWCIRNDAECREIAARGRRLYREKLCKQGVEEYTRATLRAINARQA